jgi:hypothetical protein
VTSHRPALGESGYVGQLGQVGAKESGFAVLAKGDGERTWRWVARGFTRGGSRSGRRRIQESECEQERAEREDRGESKAEGDGRQGAGVTRNAVGARQWIARATGRDASPRVGRARISMERDGVQ